MITNHSGFCNRGSGVGGTSPILNDCGDYDGNTCYVWRCSNAKNCAGLIAHEQGHLTGLEHTDSNTDIMFSTVDPAVAGYENQSNGVKPTVAGKANCRTTQNSYQVMLSRMGAWPGGPKPDPFAPGSVVCPAVDAAPPGPEAAAEAADGATQPDGTALPDAGGGVEGGAGAGGSGGMGGSGAGGTGGLAGSGGGNGSPDAAPTGGDDAPSADSRPGGGNVTGNDGGCACQTGEGTPTGNIALISTLAAMAVAQIRRRRRSVP